MAGSGPAMTGGDSGLDEEAIVRAAGYYPAFASTQRQFAGSLITPVPR